jgi:hypothetical protein
MRFMILHKLCALQCVANTTSFMVFRVTYPITRIRANYNDDHQVDQEVGAHDTWHWYAY